MRIFLSVFNITVLLLFVHVAHAQKEINMDSKPGFMDRIYTGGGFAFSSSSNTTYIGVSPIVGYMLTNKLSVGVGINYQYFKDKFFDVDDHRYGGNVFVIQMLVYRLFLMGQYSFINLNPTPQIENAPRQTWSRFLIGGGLSQPLGRASLNFMALYDITHNNSSPYASPWVIGAFISI